MLGVFQHSVSPPVPSLHNFSSYRPASDLVAHLDYALRHAPCETRAELKELCDWLVCCKHIWPETASKRFAPSATPFDAHQRNQTLHPDPACVEKTLRNIIGANDDGLMKDINDYVKTYNRPHWRALRRGHHPATRIDPCHEPIHWPEKWLKWAVLTMNMNGADLSHAKLDGLNVSGLGFRGAILFGCDLRGLIAQGCDLEYADFSHALMNEADPADSKVAYALFRRTQFPGANLSGLRFSTRENNLESANFEGARLGGIDFDRGPYEIGKGLPPPLDLHIRKYLNYRVKQEHGSLAVKYLHRFLPHIEVFSADLCKDCFKLTPAEDRPALLQKFVRHAVDLHGKGKLDDIKSFYEAIDIPVYRQFLNRIDKENLDVLRAILKEICREMPAYLESASQNDSWREFLTMSTKACQKLGLATTRRLLKDITVVIFREVKSSVERIASIGLALEHLSDANPAPAFQTLICDLPPERLGSLIWEDLVVAANRPLSSDAATSAPTGPGGKETSPASVQQGNLRQLIDLLHEWLPSDIKIHTLLQDDADDADEMNEACESKKSIRVEEGDCDYLDSYTADDTSGTYTGIYGAAANLHADQIAFNDAPAEPVPVWKSAIFAYMMLPAAHYLERYTAGFSFSTEVAANDDSGSA